MILALVILIVTSCDPFGTKADKRLEYTFKLLEDDSTPAEIESSLSAISKRLEAYGEKPEIKQRDQSSVFTLTMETAAEEERVTKLLMRPGKLEFFKIYPSAALAPYFSRLDSLVFADVSNMNGIFLTYPGMTESLLVEAQDTAIISAYVSQNKVLNLLGKHKNTTKFLWGKPLSEGAIPLYIVQTKPGGNAPLTNNNIAKVTTSYNQIGRPVIDISMDSKGARIWEEMTGDAFKNQFAIAMVIDDVVFSAPGVSSGPILGGKTEISGDFTQEECEDLVWMLNSNRIPRLEMLNFTKMPLK